MFHRPSQQRDLANKIQINQEDIQWAWQKSSSLSFSDLVMERQLSQAYNISAQCYTTGNAQHPNKFCSVANTPRQGTFLMIACPTAKTNDYSQCSCSIGVGKPEQAPNVVTCDQCMFCKDQSLAYDCRNVADGTCIGMTCGGQCVSSYLPLGNLAGAMPQPVGIGNILLLWMVLMPIWAHWALL